MRTGPAQRKRPRSRFGCCPGRGLLITSVLAFRKHPVGSEEVTGIAVRSLLQIILMLRFGFPKRADWFNLGDYFALPKPGGIHIGDGVLGDVLLLFIDIIDARPVGQPTIVALRATVTRQVLLTFAGFST